MMEKSWKENKSFIVFQSIVKRFDYLVIILHYFPLCCAMQDSLKLAIKPDLIEKIWIQEQIMYLEEISSSGWRWGRLLHFCADWVTISPLKMTSSQVVEMLFNSNSPSLNTWLTWMTRSHQTRFMWQKILFNNYVNNCVKIVQRGPQDKPMGRGIRLQPI